DAAIAMAPTTSASSCGRVRRAIRNEAATPATNTRNSGVVRLESATRGWTNQPRIPVVAECVGHNRADQPVSGGGPRHQQDRNGDRDPGDDESRRKRPAAAG